MPTGYPGALDVLANPIATDSLDTPSVYHDQQHANSNDAIEAIQTTLGINPHGSFLTVDARLDDHDAKFAAIGTPAVASGLATLDGTTKLAQNVDAGKITTGTIAVARLPTIDAAQTGTGTFAVARIPSLDTSKITTGIFNIARIPDFDAAKITTGTIAAARLPGAVTGTNTVVADIAARNALTGKIDGMFVFVNNIEQVFEWKASASRWVPVPDVQHFLLGSTLPATLSAVWNNVTGFSFSAVAGFSYAIDGVAFYQSPASSTPDLRLGWSWTGTGVMSHTFNGIDATVASPNFSGNWNSFATVGDAASPLQPTTALGAPSGIQVAGDFHATYVCSASGTVQLMLAQGTSDAVNTTSLYPGTRMRVEAMK